MSACLAAKNYRRNEGRKRTEKTKAKEQKAQSPREQRRQPRGGAVRRMLCDSFHSLSLSRYSLSLSLSFDTHSLAPSLSLVLIHSAWSAWRQPQLARGERTRRARSKHGDSSVNTVARPPRHADHRRRLLWGRAEHDRHGASARDPPASRSTDKTPQSKRKHGGSFGICWTRCCRFHCATTRGQDQERASERASRQSPPRLDGSRRPFPALEGAACQRSSGGTDHAA